MSQPSQWEPQSPPDVLPSSVLLPPFSSAAALLLSPVAAAMGNHSLHVSCRICFPLLLVFTLLWLGAYFALKKGAPSPGQLLITDPNAHSVRTTAPLYSQGGKAHTNELHADVSVSHQGESTSQTVIIHQTELVSSPIIHCKQRLPHSNRSREQRTFFAGCASIVCRVHVNLRRLIQCALVGGSKGVANLEYFDYNVNEDGEPEKTIGGEPGMFRCAGDCHMAFGFQLTVSSPCEPTD